MNREETNLTARIPDADMPTFGSKQMLACMLSCTIIFGAQFLRYLI